MKIDQVIPPESYGMPKEKTYRVCIFLNVFDVHSTRAPCNGTVEKILYHPGQFFNASLDKASEKNERNTMVIKREDKSLIAVVQIAGLIARRICCYNTEGDDIKTADIWGFIRFGSRVEVFMPPGVVPQVLEGQRTLGGETILANTKIKAPLQ